MRKKFWPAGGGSVLTGSGGEGAQRGGRRMEAEREREREREEDPGAVWSSVPAARQRPGRGARGRHVVA
jgi:hypothetical protein